MIYKLEKPNSQKIDHKKLSENLIGYFGDRDNLKSFFEKTTTPEYLYWDKVKYRERPNGLGSEEFWTLVKIFRNTQAISTVIQDEKTSKYFSWVRLHGLEKFLHDIDLNMGGNLFAFINDLDEKNKNKFIARGVMEEAIASSQLEGAHTTRKVAKQFLREGRAPRNESEQMILNNFITMNALEKNYRHKKLSRGLLFELHAMITKSTVVPDEQGRFRTDEDNIVVSDRTTGTIYHIPPKRAFIEKTIDTLISFTNDELDTSFIHPVIKAIMIHFWIGYLHPFTDGNGRLARLLFYWYLLKNDYWAFAYIPISSVIKRAATDYGHAYVYSEQDDLDLTYFIDYNIRKIKLATKEFQEYLQEKFKGNKAMNKSAKNRHHLNDRQIQLLQFLHANPTEVTNMKMHMNIYQVSKATAIKDLKTLKKLHFLKSEKISKNVYYKATVKVKDLFS